MYFTVIFFLHSLVLYWLTRTTELICTVSRFIVIACCIRKYDFLGFCLDISIFFIFLLLVSRFSTSLIYFDTVTKLSKPTQKKKQIKKTHRHDDQKKIVNELMKVKCHTHRETNTNLHKKRCKCECA